MGIKHSTYLLSFLLKGDLIMNAKQKIVDANDYAQDVAANIEVGPEEKKVIRDVFPSNSKKVVAKKEESKVVDKVIKGKVVTRKKGIGKRFTETFLGEDVKGVGSYIVYDILIPAAKDTLEDLVKGSIEVLLRGESRGTSRVKRDKGKSYVSYSSYYKSDRDDRDRRDRDRREPSSRNRSRHKFDDIILESRGEAEEVLDLLVDHIEQYDMVTVSDLYGMVGIDPNFTDEKYGWTNLSSATVSRVRDGYLIDLPKTVQLD